MKQDISSNPEDLEGIRYRFNDLVHLGKVGHLYSHGLCSGQKTVDNR